VRRLSIIPHLADAAQYEVYAAYSGGTGRGPAARNAAVSALGSRTYESVERQAIVAVENMLRVLHGQTPHAQANIL
jgi:hypothetical protein